jgi:hypothetical protein
MLHRLGLDGYRLSLRLLQRASRNVLRWRNGGCFRATSISAALLYYWDFSNEDFPDRLVRHC